jgi:putative FmdB family regulatory protein
MFPPFFIGGYMPNYVYRCTNCGFEIEIILRIADRDAYVGKGCGNCDGKDTLIRVPAAGTFMINGYCEATGYATKRSRK